MRIKQVYKTPLQKRPTGIMETVNVMKRGYQRALAYEKKEDDRKFELNDERIARIVRTRMHLECDRITAIIDEMTLPVDVNACRSSTGSFASGWVETFKVSTINILWPLYAR